MTKVKSIAYEVPFCENCVYRKKECQMKQMNDMPFDEMLLEYFPNIPDYIDDFIQYKEVSVKALDVPEIEEIFYPVVPVSMTVKSPISFIPFSAMSFNKTVRPIAKNKESNTKLCLAMNGKDDVLEEFISKSDWTDFVKAKGFDFMFSPNFSFYYNQPSCSIVLNRLKTYKAIKDALDANIPVVPAVSYVWLEDLKSYASWIKKSGFKYVYINAQMVKQDSTYQVFLENAKNILSVFQDSDIKIIISGIFSVPRVRDLRRLSDKFIFISSFLAVFAQQRLLWTEKGEKKVSGSESLFCEGILAKSVVNYLNAIKIN